MKTKKLIIFFSLILGLTMISCEGTYDFDKEQYKKSVYLMGGNNEFHIFDRSIADLKKGQDTLYMTVGVGGSQTPNKDITVTLEESDSLFRAYNKSNYDIDTAKFARMLKPEFYTLTTKEVVIKSGTSTATIPVILKNLDQLSPDSIYFLNYKISSVSEYEISKKQSHALFRIYYKNRWSNTKQVPIYNVSAYQVSFNEATNTAEKDTTIIAGSPKVFPISKNTVRLVPGSMKYDNLENINKNSFLIEVEENPIKANGNIYKVHIKQYKDLYVEQADPDPTSGNIYKNVFIDEKVQIKPGVYTYFKRFMIRFKYKDPATNKMKLIEEKVSIQYNPKTEL